MRELVGVIVRRGGEADMLGEKEGRRTRWSCADFLDEFGGRSSRADGRRRVGGLGVRRLTCRRRVGGSWGELDGGRRERDEVADRGPLRLRLRAALTASRIDLKGDSLSLGCSRGVAGVRQSSAQAKETGTADEKQRLIPRQRRQSSLPNTPALSSSSFLQTRRPFLSSKSSESTREERRESATILLLQIVLNETPTTSF